MSARENPQLPAMSAPSLAVQVPNLDQDDKDSIGFYCHELGRLLSLAATLAVYLDNDEAALKAKYTPEATGFGIENLYLAWDSHLLNEHRNRVRSMLLVAAVSEAEAALRHMLDTARERCGVASKIGDQSGNEFDRIQKYAVKVLVIDSSLFASKPWCQIRDWLPLRNALVHAQGFVEKPEGIRACKNLGVPLVNDDLGAACGMAQLKAQHVGELGGHVADFLEALYIALKSKGIRPLSPYLRAADDLVLDGVPMFPE